MKTTCFAGEDDCAFGLDDRSPSEAAGPPHPAAHSATEAVQTARQACQVMNLSVP
jgi:hypothetical protein